MRNYCSSLDNIFAPDRNKFIRLNIGFILRNVLGITDLERDTEIGCSAAGNCPFYWRSVNKCLNRFMTYLLPTLQLFNGKMQVYCLIVRPGSIGTRISSVKGREKTLRPSKRSGYNWFPLSHLNHLRALYIDYTHPPLSESDSLRFMTPIKT